MKLTSALSLLFILVFLIDSRNSQSQSRNFWIGDNLTEVVQRDSFWHIHLEDWYFTLIEKDGKYYTIDLDIREISNVPHDAFLDPDADTIRYYSGLDGYLFVRPEMITRKPFDFHTFTYAIVDSWGQDTVSYTLDRNGLLRKINKAAEVVLEKHLDTETLDAFFEVINPIDIMHMDKASGWQTQCDEYDHCYTFRDKSGKEYAYQSMYPRSQLAAVSGFIIKQTR